MAKTKQGRLAAGSAEQGAPKEATKPAPNVRDGEKKKVRILVGVAGSNFAYRRNQEVEINKQVAEKWIKAGIAADLK